MKKENRPRQRNLAGFDNNKSNKLRNYKPVNSYYARRKPLTKYMQAYSKLLQGG